MYKITFENSLGEERQIGEVEKENEILLIINDFLTKHSFKSYYTRIWSPEKGHTIWDVGSHTEFFHVYSKEYGGV